MQNQWGLTVDVNERARLAEPKRVSAPAGSMSQYQLMDQQQLIKLDFVLLSLNSLQSICSIQSLEHWLEQWLSYRVIVNIFCNPLRLVLSTSNVMNSSWKWNTGNPCQIGGTRHWISDCFNLYIRCSKAWSLSKHQPLKNHHSVPSESLDHM